MEIRILDRDTARKQSYTIDKSCIIISIQDVSESQNEFCKNNPNIKNVLYVAFGDIEEVHEGSHVLPMSICDAIKIKCFVDNWKDKVELIIVHCSAGISRSSAIGHFYNNFLNNTNIEELFKNPHYSPNMNCFKLMNEVYGIHICKDKIEDLRNINDIASAEYFKNSKDPIIQRLNKQMVTTDNKCTFENINFK